MEPSATEYMTMPLKRYADFSGRSRRKEYWLFQLLAWGSVFVAGMVAAFLSAPFPVVSIVGILVVGLIVPLIAVQVRRFHDLGMSGWFSLLGIIPYVGGLIVLYFMVKPGNAGPNQYGQDPKDPNDINNLQQIF